MINISLNKKRHTHVRTNTHLQLGIFRSHRTYITEACLTRRGSYTGILGGESCQARDRGSRVIMNREKFTGTRTFSLDTL